MLNEQLQFIDSIAAIDADNRSRSYIQEVEFRHHLGRGHAWQGGLTHTWQEAQASGFASIRPQQQQAALWMSYRYTSSRHPWTYALSLRQGWNPAQDIPLTPDLSLRGQLARKLYLRAQAGRSFRLPTFNDRYWNPGGNPDLLPEQGWHQEIGLDFIPRRWQFHLTSFHQLIDQWIQWRPGPSYWFPENLRKVRSLGLESSAAYSFKVGGWRGDLTAAHTLTRARSVEVVQARDASLDKQLIYTPAHQGRVGITAFRRSWQMAYGHAWTGRRYTTSDNAFFLQAYQAAHFSMQYVFRRQRWQARMGGRIDNLWNADFQVIENRPIPPRSYRLTLSFQFHQPIPQSNL
ncbi:MAG: TonB-dependent receptor [Bacteroidota bacterium]